MAALPGWVPPAIVDYVRHTRDGLTMRALARSGGCEPSTVSRRIRRVEHLRDDILVDSAILRLGGDLDRGPEAGTRRKGTETMKDIQENTLPDEATLDREAPRILRRLAEQGACLALAPAMETAVVVREAGDGPTLRTAVVERAVAEAMALKGWIANNGTGRILRYRITTTGRAALRDFVARAESRKARVHGTGEAFAEEDADGAFERDPSERRAPRYSLAETPLATLARRRDKDGQPFLGAALVAAGERLREDFELSRLGARVVRDWDRYLNPSRSESAPATPKDATDAARMRVEKALAALGPGLGDVALRCCCLLEGLESTERRMGWSARSGKIVLRIALQRLKLHYDAHTDHWSPLIG